MIFFRFWGAPGTPRDPKKVMKNMALSSKINVSLISKNVVPDNTFGAIWAHFSAPFDAFGLPDPLLDDPGRPRGRRKAATDRKKMLPNLPRRP